MNKYKSENGITLIALIVTIIILLILAVVAISSVNDGGIIQKAQDATAQYKIAQEKEQIGLAVNLWQLENSMPGKNLTFKEVIEAELSGEINIPVTENGDGSLTVVFTKTRNIYKVEKNGNITKLEDKNNDDNGDETTNDFAIIITKGENGVLSIKTEIPDSWNERDFKEDEEDYAAQVVAKSMGLKLNGETITNLKELIIAGVNYKYGSILEKTYTKDDYNTMITEIDSMIDADISTPEAAFKFMLESQNITGYETVQQYAAVVYKYTPTTKVLKIRKNNEEWIDITQQATWNNCDSTYQVYSNSIYEFQLKLDDKVAISNQIEVSDIAYLGKYVKYDANGNGRVDDETILWRVLRDDPDKVELISVSGLGNVDLSYYSYEQARTNYNNLVEILVEECKRVTGITEKIRNVGGPAEDITMDERVSFAELVETTEFSPTVSIDKFKKYEDTTNGFKQSNEEQYLDDYKQMQKIGAVVAWNIEDKRHDDYLYATRCINATSDEVQFCVRAQVGSSESNYIAWLPIVYNNGLVPDEMSGGFDSISVRPVIELESGIFKNTAQPGTENQPIEIYQDN